MIFLKFIDFGYFFRLNLYCKFTEEIHIYGDSKFEREVLAYVNNADEKLLKLMEALAETYKKETQGDWWETLTETEKEDINKGIEDVNSGRVIENEEVMKLFEKWH